MTLYDYTNKEYVNPVDLTVLNKVYDSLETSHNLALDTASATKQALATLPLNPKENQFIADYSNQIDKIIEQNSRFGNAGYALDSIKKLAGDISSDPVLRTKLQNNQAWMEFNKKLENYGLSQPTINRLKELNPYEDNGYINWETGERVEGDEWKPKVDAASPVSRTDIYKTILNICATQYGDDGTQFLYLDKDGKPVNTPEESGDKIPYMYKDGKYVQLSKEQLEKTYKLLLHDHPEIAASLRQEYDDFQWLYDKEKERNLAEGNDSIPYIPGYTDENGLCPSFEDWVNTSIGQFADIASYTEYKGIYKRISGSTSLGGSSSSSSGSSSDTTGMDMLPYTTIELATTTVNVDPYESAMSSYLSAYSTLCEFEPFSANFDTADGDIVKFIDNIEKNGGFDKYISGIENNNKITSDDKKDILSALNCIKENRKMITQIENTSKNPELYRYNEMASIDRYEANNKYGKEIIKKLNDFNLADGTITYTFKNGSLYKDLIGEYRVEDIRDIDGLNISKDKDGNYVVTFDSRNQNLLPKFNYIIHEAENKNKPVGSWFQKTFTPNTVYDYNFLVNTTGNADNRDMQLTYSDTFGHGNFTTRDNTLYNSYKNYKEKATKLQKENNVSIQFPIKGFSYETFDEFIANDFVKSGRGTYEAGRKYAKDLRTALRDGMKKANFSNGSIQLRIDGEFKTIMKDTKEYETLIKTMFTQYPKSCNISQIVNNVKDGELQDMIKPSYYISMNVPDEKDNAKYEILKDKKFKGKEIELIVQGPIVNSTNYNPAYSPILIAQNQVYIANQSSTDIQGLNYVYGFGDTSLKKNGNFKYSGTFCDKDITLTTQEACELYAADLLYAQALKSTYKIALNNGTEDEKTIANNSFNTLAESMSKNTGVNLDVVKDCLTKYLKQ